MSAAHLFRIGQRCRVHKPGTWMHRQPGTVLDVLGTGRLAAVAIEFDRLEFDGRRRVFILHAHQLHHLPA